MAGLCASATTLSSNLTADNSFSLYLSTSDSALGTLVGTGGDWTTTYSFNSTLTSGVTNYIHVVALNSGGPGGYIGDFTLSDANFQFANGTQSLLTETTDWGYSTTGFGGPYITPGDEGANGVGPWGTRANISSSAHWLWDPSNSDAAGPAYFSTPIAYVGSTVGTVPEPGTFALLALGVPFLFRRRRNGRG